MENIRVIPRLDIKGPNLVKGIHLEGLRVLGLPEEFASHYYNSGADELIFQDVVASLYERNSLDEVITKTAKELFIPLTVGGGLRTLEDIKNVLRAGADKVSLNTAAIKNPNIIEQASREFGSSTVVIAIEAIKEPDGKYLAYVDNGREHTGVEVREWAKQVESMGAGEIVVTSVDREGTGLGFDVELVSLVSQSVSLPVIAHGGAGTLDDISDVVINGGASAVTVAAMLHYDALVNAEGVIKSSSSEDEGNVEFLKSGRGFQKVSPHSLQEIKQHLVSKDISCRRAA